MRLPSISVYSQSIDEKLGVGATVITGVDATPVFEPSEHVLDFLAPMKSQSWIQSSSGWEEREWANCRGLTPSPHMMGIREHDVA
jgi:hypothetical protein